MVMASAENAGMEKRNVLSLSFQEGGTLVRSQHSMPKVAAITRQGLSTCAKVSRGPWTSAYVRVKREEGSKGKKRSFWFSS